LVDLVWQAAEHFEGLDHPMMAPFPPRRRAEPSQYRLAMQELTSVSRV